MAVTHLISTMDVYDYIFIEHFWFNPSESSTEPLSFGQTRGPGRWYIPFAPKAIRATSH